MLIIAAGRGVVREWREGKTLQLENEKRETREVLKSFRGRRGRKSKGDKEKSCWRKKIKNKRVK